MAAANPAPVSYRIGKVTDKSTAAQIVAPLTCWILSAFDRHDVPQRFSVLRDSINDFVVDRDGYVADVTRMLTVFFPRHLCVDDSKLIQDLAETMKCSVCEAACLYLTAFLIPRPEAYHARCPNGSALKTFMQVAAGISKQRDLARTRVDLVLRSLLKMELEDRFWVVARVVDAPFWLPGANEHAVVAMAHYHPPFVQEFKKTVRPFVRNVERVHELVSMDFDLFASALGRLPPTSEATKRMEDLIFPGGHPEAGRVVWAFCSIWFLECLATYQRIWSLSGQTMRRLALLSREGRTITLLEATRPFGSVGTRLIS